MALVVLLRGVNVGGNKTFRPTELVKTLKQLGIVNIGAAGTFVVHKPITESLLRAEFAKRLPFETEIIICNGREIVNALAHRCYAKEPEGAEFVRFVSVLSKEPKSTTARKLPVQLPEKGDWLLRILARDKRMVFGMYRRDPKVIGYLGQIDKLLGAMATTRNWNTINAIAKVVSQRE